MAKKKVFSTSIDSDRIKDLKHLAVDTDKSLGNLLEEAIKDIVEKYRDNIRKMMNTFIFHKLPKYNQFLYVLGAFTQRCGPDIQGIFMDWMFKNDGCGPKNISSPDGDLPGDFHGQVFCQ